MNRFFKDNFYKRRVVLLSATFLLTSLISVSCKKVESTIGKGVQGDADQLGLKKTDTFSLITYSKLKDSVRSDEKGFVLLGSYNDPVFGQVSTGFATQLRLQGNNPDFGGVIGENELTVDSVVLSLDYTLGYGDMDPQYFKVHRLNTSVKPDSAFYNFSTPDFDPLDLVEFGSNVVTPNITDSTFVGDVFTRPQLRIRLDKSLGEEFINETANQNLLDDNSFITYFPGIYVTTENTQSPGEGGVFVFKVGDIDSKVTMYYHDDTDTSTFSFVLGTNNGYFNKIDYDNSMTDVYNQYQNDSTMGQNQFYLQSGKVEPRVSLPTFPNLMGKNIAINKADLVLPVQYFSESSYVPSNVLYVYADDDGENEIITTDIAEFDPINKNYSFDLTWHLQRVQTGEVTNKELVFSSNTFFTTVQRTVLNGANSTLKERPKLIVTYTEY